MPLSAGQSSLTSLFLDLGGVLYKYSPSKGMKLTRRQMKNALDSPSWYDFECGKISAQGCYQAICDDFGFELESFTQAVDDMRQCSRPNHKLIKAIHDIKSTYPAIKIRGLSNIPKEAYEFLRDLIDSWGIFDEFYASSDLKCRKPDSECFIATLNMSGEIAQRCVFIDDKLENVIAARCRGFQTILHKDNDETIATLHQLLGDPISRGLEYLERNAKKLISVTDAGIPQPDNYSQLLILQTTGNRNLVTLDRAGHTWNYFIGEPVFADTVYLDDSDTTSLAMTVLDDVSEEEKQQARVTIKANLNPDGLPYCWLDSKRPRFCHCICANVFRFFYLNNDSDSLPGVFDYICGLLRTRSYLLGTRYYEQPDWFLYILGDLCRRRPRDKNLDELRALLKSSIVERMGCGTNILAAVLRLLSAQAVGLDNPRDLDTVLKGQKVDGGWEMGWLWKCGKEDVMLGSRGVVTAMAVKAIENAQALEVCLRGEK